MSLWFTARRDIVAGVSRLLMLRCCAGDTAVQAVSDVRRLIRLHLFLARLAALMRCRADAASSKAYSSAAVNKLDAAAASAPPAVGTGNIEHASDRASQSGTSLHLTLFGSG